MLHRFRQWNLNFANSQWIMFIIERLSSFGGNMHEFFLVGAKLKYVRSITSFDITYTLPHEIRHIWYFVRGSRYLQLYVICKWMESDKVWINIVWLRLSEHGETFVAMAWTLKNTLYWSNSRTVIRLRDVLREICQIRCKPLEYSISRSNVCIETAFSDRETNCGMY